MKPNIFIKKNQYDDTIYLDNKIVGNFATMINIIINNPDVKYNFENFNKIELKTAKIILKKINKAMKKSNNKKDAIITTHKVKEYTKKYYYIDVLSSYKNPFPFEIIDKIEFKRIGNRDIIIIEGIKSVYGINNEYGFYNIEDDEFIPNYILQENNKIEIEALEGSELIQYIKRRVR